MLGTEDNDLQDLKGNCKYHDGLVVILGSFGLARLPGLLSLFVDRVTYVKRICDEAEPCTCMGSPNVNVGMNWDRTASTETGLD